MQRNRFLSLAITLPLLAAATLAQSPASSTVTLEDCVRMALEKNLDVQISRVSPDIATLNLKGAYSAYEPLLDVTLGYNGQSSPGRVDPGTGVPQLATSSEQIFFGSRGAFISGLAPTGLRYQIGMSYSHSERDDNRLPDEHSANVSLTLSQPLLRDGSIDSTRQIIALNKENLKMSELMLRQQIMATLLSVENTYYEVIYAREFVRVQEKALELAERLLAENRKRVEVGALAPLDEKQAEAQVASSKADLLSAQRVLITMQNQLKSLLTDDYATIQGTDLVPAGRLSALPVALQLQYSWLKALTQRPDLDQLRVDLLRRDITIRYNRNQMLPSLDLFGSYGRSGYDSHFENMTGQLGEGDFPSGTVGLNLSIPLGNGAARSRLRASEAERRQSLLQLKKLEQSVLVEVDNAVGQIRISFERVEATRQARVYAEAALDAEQKKLENGKSTSFMVLQFQRDLTAAAVTEIRALADYNIRLAQLAYSEGSTLERHRLDLAVR